MRKKLLSIMCILALVFTSVVPASAMEMPVSSVPTPVVAEVLHINPIYEDVIDEEDLRMELAEASQYAVQPLDDITYHTDEEQVADILRQAMVERQASVTIGFANEENYSQEIHDQLVEMALEETDSPKAGDYLAFQYGGCGAGGSVYVENGVYYLTLIFSIAYYTTAEQEQEMDAAVEDVLDELDLEWHMNDYEKVCSIYDYICNHVTYDYDHLNDDSYKLQFTAYAALVQGKAVCQGYANLFYRLAKEVGLSPRIVRGWQTSSGGGHAWNIVKLGDLYYNLDATWDSSYVQAGYPYNFFLKGWDTYEDHTFREEYSTAPFITAYPMSTEDYVPGAIEDEPKDIDQAHAYLAEDTFIYNGNNHVPEVIVEGLEFGIDYDVEYLDNLEAGQATAIVRGIGSFCGEIRLPFSIEKLDISGMEADAVLSQESFIYSGEPCEPTVVLESLMQDMDYTVSYENNEDAGTATVVVTGFGNCKGEFRREFTINKADIADVLVTLDQDYYYYTGEPVQPVVDAGMLMEGKDFELSYSDNNAVGIGVATLTGQGNYTGTVSVSFEIRECEHDWDEGTVTKTPNCHEAGQQLFVCSICESERTEVLATNDNHKMSPWQTETAATCSNSGVEYRVCENGCGKKEEQPTSALEHDIVIDAAVEATCSKTGLTAGQHCSRCDDATVLQIKTEVKPHNEVTDVVKATKTSAGRIVTKCTVCKKTLKSKTIPAIKTVSLSYKQKVYTGSSISAPKLTVTDTNGNEITSYTVKGLTSKKYVGRYKVTVTFKGNYEGSTNLYFTIVPKKVSSITVNLNSADQSKGYNDIKATWTKATGATGYLVYYKKASASTWTSAGSTTKTSYTKKDLGAGTKYTFKVVPYYKEAGKTTKYSDANQYRSASTTTLKQVTGIKAAKSGTKVKVSWTNINGETGYQISKTTKKSSTQKSPTTVKSSTAKSKLITATKGKTYYYRVRAYKVVDGKKVYGPWSDAKAYKRR